MKKYILVPVILALVAILPAGCILSVLSSGDDAAEFSHGAVLGDVYASEFASLEFTAPDGWIYADDAQLAGLMDVGEELLEDSKLEFDMEVLEKQIIYDMMAQNPATGSNVIVMYDNLKVTGSAEISVEDYVDLTKNQMEDAQIYNYAFHDPSEDEIGGETYTLLVSELPDYDAAQYMYIRKIDKYMLCVIVSVFGNDDISDLMECFS